MRVLWGFSCLVGVARFQYGARLFMEWVARRPAQRGDIIGVENHQPPCRMGAERIVAGAVRGPHLQPRVQHLRSSRPGPSSCIFRPGCWALPVWRQCTTDTAAQC